MTKRALVAWMIAAIAAVAALAFWDEERESAAALEDFAEAQATVARALAASLGSSLRLEQVAGSVVAMSAMQAVEQPGAVLVLLKRPNEAGMTTTGGEHVHSARVEEALARDDAWLRLSRAEAAALGLPARTAMAGLSRVDVRGAWGIAVIATARRERDRELRAGRRLVLGVLVASGLVLAFGGAALRRQRKELELARELAIAERDERLERAGKLAALGAVATGIAHEVSTPLGVIVGRAEQLAPKVKDDERAERAVSAILAQAERIGAIVRGILALVRGEATSFERVDAGSLARAAADLVEHRFARAGVTLVRREPARAEVLAEPRLFEQVLVNLLLNACDACAHGGRVEFAVERDGDRVVFAVIDDGEGIAPDVVARAMEPFVSTKGAGGSGMGLAIASELVKHHRGTLSLGPRDDGRRGTRAVASLPAAPAT